MSILCILLKSSVTIQQQMIQNKGFLVIGYFLEKVGQLRNNSWKPYVYIVFAMGRPLCHEV